jgi:antirestriction protein ArdC
MTFKQAKELGAHIRKGEKGTKVVYANTFTKAEKDEETGEEKEQRPYSLTGSTMPRDR